MPERELPSVLIVSHAGRGLAAAARHHAASIAVIDLFADDDLAELGAVAYKIAAHASPSEIGAAAQAAAWRLMPTSEIEIGFGSLDLFVAPIQAIIAEFLSDWARRTGVTLRILGNDAATRQRASDVWSLPSVIAKIGAKYGVTLPPTRNTPPDDATGWLRKPRFNHAGGYGIDWIAAPARHECYWQKFEAGRVFGVNFAVSSEGGVAVLGLVENFTDPTADAPMRWGGIAGWAQPTGLATDWLPACCRGQDWVEICRHIAAEFSLTGLNGMDIIAAPSGEIFVLEINPRPTAASALWQDQAGWLWRLHHGEAIPLSLTRQNYGRAKAILYAAQATMIAENFIWPDFSHDHSPPGLIAAGQPICSIETQAATPLQAWHNALVAKTALARRLGKA
ncbi:MAG: ATP-grasp domain-containing protein [Candidatus Symbiobacter sp.]|nr:ATP-grasp domain-containing protein [Candidatus Symbiobacter sp.]